VVRRLTATVTGRVQGVGFRWFVQRMACSSGLTGFVRNLPNGGVEAVAEGDEQALDRLLDALRQGPPAARIEDVKAAWSEAQNTFTGFTIEH
jgi:acylphosphatase